MASSHAAAGSLVENFCGGSTPLSAAQMDQQLRFAAVVRDEMEKAGAAAVLIARSGLDLSRFQLRYSHGGVALAQGGPSPWSVRQLYYACDEGRPRLFDQGLAGFVGGSSEPDRGFVSLLLLPPEAAQALASSALDTSKVGPLLASSYSANAHAWSLRYQNCNQWLVELLAVSAGGLDAGADLRAQAQGWLRTAGYQASTVNAGSHLVMFAGALVPWIHLDDRPEDERHSLAFQVSLPQSIEAFVQARWPQTQRIEFCHVAGRALVRRGGWQPLREDCQPEVGDEQHQL